MGEAQPAASFGVSRGSWGPRADLGDQGLGVWEPRADQAVPVVAENAVGTPVVGAALGAGIPAAGPVPAVAPIAAQAHDYSDAPHEPSQPPPKRVARTGTNSSHTFCHTAPTFCHPPPVGHALEHWQPPSIEELQAMMAAPMTSETAEQAAARCREAAKQRDSAPADCRNVSAQLASQPAPRAGTAVEPKAESPVTPDSAEIPATVKPAPQGEALEPPAAAPPQPPAPEPEKPGPKASTTRKRKQGDGEAAKPPAAAPPQPPAPKPEKSGPKTSTTRKRNYPKPKPRQVWTADEHQRFLDAIEKFGRQWPKVRSAVGEYPLSHGQSGGDPAANPLCCKRYQDRSAGALARTEALPEGDQERLRRDGAATCESPPKGQATDLGSVEAGATATSAMKNSSLRALFGWSQHGIQLSAQGLDLCLEVGSFCLAYREERCVVIDGAGLPSLDDALF